MYISHDIFHITQLIWGIAGRERCQTKHKEMENRREGQQPESGGEISLLPINQQVDMSVTCPGRRGSHFMNRRHCE